MKLFYSHNLNPRVAVAVARYLESPVEYVRVSPRRPDQIDAFRAINPNALVPVLSDGAGTLWETDAIACRLSKVAGSDFWRTDESLPEMIKWISWSALSSDPGRRSLVFLSDRRPDAFGGGARSRDHGTGAAGFSKPRRDPRIPSARPQMDHGRSDLLRRFQGRDAVAVRRRRRAAVAGISKHQPLARAPVGHRRLARSVPWVAMTAVGRNSVAYSADRLMTGALRCANAPY